MSGMAGNSLAGILAPTRLAQAGRPESEGSTNGGDSPDRRRSLGKICVRVRYCDVSASFWEGGGRSGRRATLDEAAALGDGLKGVRLAKHHPTANDRRYAQYLPVDVRSARRCMPRENLIQRWRPACPFVALRCCRVGDRALTASANLGLVPVVVGVVMHQWSVILRNGSGIPPTSRHSRRLRDVSRLTIPSGSYTDGHTKTRWAAESTQSRPMQRPVLIQNTPVDRAVRPPRRAPSPIAELQHPRRRTRPYVRFESVRRLLPGGRPFALASTTAMESLDDPESRQHHPAWPVTASRSIPLRMTCTRFRSRLDRPATCRCALQN